MLQPGGKAWWGERGSDLRGGPGAEGTSAGGRRHREGGSAVPGLCCWQGIFEVEGRVQLTVLVEVRSPCIFDPLNGYVTEVPVIKVYLENCCYCTSPLSRASGT